MIEKEYSSKVSRQKDCRLNRFSTSLLFEAVKSLKKQKNIHLNCAVSTDVVEQFTDYMVARVTLKFENFTKTDLVTLVREGKDWRVSKSINSYK